MDLELPLFIVPKHVYNITRSGACIPDQCLRRIISVSSYCCGNLGIPNMLANRPSLFRSFCVVDTFFSQVDSKT